MDSGSIPADGPTPAVQGAGRPRTRGRSRWLATGLIAGAAVSLGVDRVWFMADRSSSHPEATVQETDKGRSPTARDGVEGPDDGLEARWETLRSDFLEMAMPVMEALDRVERLGVEPPARQFHAREAQAAYENARHKRELAEENEKNYVEVVAKSELHSVRIEFDAAEKTAGLAKAKLDDFLRSQQRVSEKWVAKGSSPGSAKKAAEVLFMKDVRNAKIGSDQAKIAIQRAKDRVDRVVGVDQPKRTKKLHAEVFAKRAEELARMADWEAAKAEESRPDPVRAVAELSPGDRRLLDVLARVVREAGPPPPADDPFEFVEFLDKFEDALHSARAVAAEVYPGGIARRYADTVDRLLRAQGTVAPK